VASRLTIVFGLLLGAIVAVGLFVGAAILVPDTALPIHTPTSSDFALRPSPSPGPSSSPSAGASASPGANPGPSGSSAANLRVGQPAPSLVVPQVGGGTIDLSSLKGKPVWVSFIASTCARCRDELRLMSSFAGRYASSGLVVIAVDVREDEGTVASYTQSLNVTFPVGLDADGSAQTAWQAAALPVHFWIDAQGVIRDASQGATGSDDMVRGLRTILPGVDVKP
jgi:cytochrome c biogenesis protein CcmG, thiol:disulfide interchange protein DsbE